MKSIRSLLAAALLAAAVGPFAKPALAAQECTIFWDAFSSGTGLATIWVGASTDCSFTIASMSGQVMLRDTTGAFVESSGNHFECTECSGGASVTNSCCYIQGSVHRREYLTTLTLPADRTWRALPSICSGAGTAVATCHVVMLFLALGSLGGCICDESWTLQPH